MYLPIYFYRTYIFDSLITKPQWLLVSGRTVAKREEERARNIHVKKEKMGVCDEIEMEALR